MARRKFEDWRANQKRPRLPACAGRKLLAGEIAALNRQHGLAMNPVRTHFECTTGQHPAHCRCKSGVPKAKKTAKAAALSKLPIGSRITLRRRANRPGGPPP